jgi:hypothetical protein
MNAFTELIDLRDTIQTIMDGLRDKKSFEVEVTPEQFKAIEECQRALTEIEEAK